MGRKKIKDRIVLRFVKKLRKKFRIEKIILFGSRATGDYLKESDYDFIIVSPDFEGMFFTERTAMLYDFWEGKQKLDALCYTPKEFEEKKKQISIVREALKHGIEL